MSHRNRDVIVTDRGDRGPAVIIGVVLAVLAVGLVVWLLFGGAADDIDAGGAPTDEVNVTIDTDG
jgi:hypothetical protein